MEFFICRCAHHTFDGRTLGMGAYINRIDLVLRRTIVSIELWTRLCKKSFVKKLHCFLVTCALKISRLDRATFLSLDEVPYESFPKLKGIYF